MDANKSIPESLKIRVLSIIVLTVSSSADAILLAFLPKFITDQKPDNSPAIYVTSFWIAVSFARAVFILRYWKI